MTPMTIKVVRLLEPSKNKDVFYSYIEKGKEFGYGPGEGKTIGESLNQLIKLIEE